MSAPNPRFSGIVLLGIVAACSPAKPNVVTITATDYAFGAPDTIQAGLTTFRMINQGREPHQAVIAGAEGKSFEAVQAAVMQEGPIAEWLTFPAAPGAAGGNDSSIVTANVTPGRCLIVCFIASPDGTLHAVKGMYRRLMVVAAPRGTAAAAAPTSDMTVTLSDYTFATSTALTAGTHTIRVENSGPQLHELAIERLKPGKTLADWQRWVAGGMHGETVADPAGGLVGPEKGKVGWLTVTLAPGNYLLNCYVPDVSDGKPHFAHGMVQQVTVS